MAIFTKDTFTLVPGETAGENLTSHHGETAAVWTELALGTGDLLINAAGQVYLGGTTGGGYYYAQYQASGTPFSADYTVQADLDLASVPAGHFAARVLGRTADANNWYAFGYEPTSGWTLIKDVAGTQSTLGSSPAALSAGATHTMALVISGSSLSGQVDGTTVVGPFTDTSISAAGTAGLALLVDTASTYTPGPTTGCALDNFLGTDTGPTITVSIVPTSATLPVGGTQQFAATVTGSANVAVTWSVQEGGSGGTITSGGLYSAPARPGTYHVVATSVANTTVFATATLTVFQPTTPGTPQITIATAAGQDTISVSAAVSPGLNPVAGYRLYQSATPGAETDTGVTISPGTFPAAFAAQTTAAAGAAKYYVVRAYDTAVPTPNYSAASNEVYSRTTALVASGRVVGRVFTAPYGASGSGLAATLGYTVYDYQGAVLQQRTTGQTYEVASGSGIYTALVDIDTAYSGVLVWDAPAGSGPYVEAFDPGALGQVSGYTSAASPATLLLQNPANKLLTNATGQVDLDWTEAVPATSTGLTLGRAALAAIAEGVGVWKYDPSAKTLQEYAEDGVTLLRSFALTIDPSGTITQRA